MKRFGLCSFFVLVGLISEHIQSRACLLCAPMKPIILTVWSGKGMWVCSWGSWVRWWSVGVWVISDQCDRSQGLLLCFQWEQRSRNLESLSTPHGKAKQESHSCSYYLHLPDAYLPRWTYSDYTPWKCIEYHPLNTCLDFCARHFWQ